MDNKIFENLFVLELANNHWGSVKRGKQIIKQFSEIVRKNKIKAAIKLQFRDVDTLVHKNFKSSDASSTNINRNRYIQKTLKTVLMFGEFRELVKYIKKNNCIPMATPFDEQSVDWCVELELPIIKIASSDINDWLLLQKIATTKKPVIISTGGAAEKQIDDVVLFLEHRNIPLAINHCISKYPSEDNELELNQIDYLRARYPLHVIGLSTHEYNDWETSMHISYAKGARTWERHIDIPYDSSFKEQTKVSSYCSLPNQIDVWFNAFNKSVLMSGQSSNVRRIIDEKEENYLTALYRGLYLKKSMRAGDKIGLIDLYSAIPYQKEIDQLNSRDFMDDEYFLNKDLKENSPITKKDIE